MLKGFFYFFFFFTWISKSSNWTTASFSPSLNNALYAASSSNKWLLGFAVISPGTGFIGSISSKSFGELAGPGVGLGAGGGVGLGPTSLVFSVTTFCVAFSTFLFGFTGSITLFWTLLCAVAILAVLVWVALAFGLWLIISWIFCGDIVPAPVVPPLLGGVAGLVAVTVVLAVETVFVLAAAGATFGLATVWAVFALAELVAGVDAWVVLLAVDVLLATLEVVCCVLSLLKYIIDKV